MYAFPGVEYRRLDQIITAGHRRIDEAVERVIAKYPAQAVTAQEIEDICGKEARKEELGSLLRGSPFEQLITAQQAAMQNMANQFQLNGYYDQSKHGICDVLGLSGIF